MAIKTSITKFVASAIAAAFLFAGIGCSGYTYLPKDITYFQSAEAIHIDMPEVDYYSWQDILNLRFYMKAKNIKELHIHMMNPGGYILTMIDTIDQLELMKKDGIKIVTHGHSVIGSAAVPIFLMGDQRIMYKSCQLFLHNSTLDKSRPYMNDDSWEAFMEWEWKYTQIIVEKTKLTKAQVEEMCSGNPDYDMTWFNAKECLKLGFCTELR